MKIPRARKKNNARAILSKNLTGSWIIDDCVINISYGKFKEAKETKPDST